MTARERQTLVPAFDPEELARELETELAREDRRPTAPPPFDPSSYARIVDANLDAAALPAERRAAEPERSEPSLATATGRTGAEDGAEDTTGVAAAASEVEGIGRAMYGSYLESDFPAALVLAERVLEKEPEHALAHLVADRCRAVLGAPGRRLAPSSVVRVRQPLPDHAALELDTTSMFVLGHVDGVADAETVAALSGIPPHVALDHLHALLDLGVLELVAV